MQSTVASLISIDQSPPSTILFYASTIANLDLQPEYTDAQFYTDIRKSKRALDKLAAQALAEYERGETREFP